VATGHNDGSVLVWKVPMPATEKVTAADRDDSWADLAATDPAKARIAIDRLAHNPDVAIALLAERFKAPPPPAEADVPSLVRALDDPAFAAREKAAKRLREVGPKVEPALRDALKTATAEAKQRIDQVLSAFENNRQPPQTGEAVRSVRAVEVLERVGTPAARRALQAWADQTVELYVAAEAGLALERLLLRDTPAK
jgi:hypothetical protein